MSRFATPIVGKINDYVVERGFSVSASTAVEEGGWEAQASIPLLPHPPPGAGTRVVPPALATAADLREVVQYLKKKPFGVTVVEALNDVKKRAFEPRKIAAYEFCGIVTRGGSDRLRLTSLGWEFASKIEPETEAYRAVLDNTPLYRATLEWIYRQDLDLVTHKDVAAYWLGNHASMLGQHDDKTLEGNALCFFHLSQAAELGTVTIGKRGQPARLRVEREELASYTESREPHTASQNSTSDSGREDDETDPAVAVSRGARSPSPPAVAQQAGQKLTTNADTRKLRVFISSIKNSKVVRQIQPTLELADIDACFAERLEPEAVPVSDHALQTMRECHAAIIVVTREDCCGGAGEADGLTLQQNILIEIGAAFVLYERRVVLLVDERLPLPPNLSGLTCFTFDEGDLTWEAGVKLMQAVKDFKSVRASIG